ncbi:hypothetical protein HDU91_001170 [Kappamyces sp. JEL0680]|nr:hypothetical protein HDU91_001170 [Kappamyces sp. JEL0680]
MHEQCFLCQRHGIRDQYFLNYSKLETHFLEEHFPCKEPSCLEQKFVVFETDLDLQGHILKEHADAKTKSKGQKIVIDFNYVGSASSRRKGKPPGQDGSGPSSARGSFQNLSIASSDDAASQGRAHRVPAGFGSQLTSDASFPTPTISHRPQVGRSSSPAPDYPLPSEAAAPVSEILLTPAQTDILAAGGPELIFAIQKLIGTQGNNLASLKLAIWSFRQGTSTAEKLLQELYSLCVAQHPKKKADQLLTEMGLVWHKIIDTFPEEATSDQIQRALEKKSKKKGLTIEEFEALRKGEPKKEAMLRVWNNHKIKVQQSQAEIMPRKQSSWAAADPSPPPGPAPKTKAPQARVMVIKPSSKQSPSSWADRSPAVPPVSRDVGSVQSADNASNSPSVAASGLSRPSSSTSLSAMTAKPSSAVVVAGPINRSQTEFPSLPATKPAKPAARGRETSYYGSSAGGPMNSWGSGADPEPSVNAQGGTDALQKGKKKKKGTVLMHFG